MNVRSSRRTLHDSLVAVPKVHNVWTMEGEERHGNEINVLNNGALLGCAIIRLHEAAANK